MWTETELAYLAGILDGEGHICALRRAGRGVGRRYVPHVGVVTTDLPLADWLETHFGGKVYHRPPNAKHPSWKLKHEWVIFQRSIDAVLPAVYPFLVIKRLHAELILDFRETFHRGNTRVPDDVERSRDLLYERLKTLNRARKMR